VSNIFRLIWGTKSVLRHGPNRLKKGLLESFFWENRREKAIYFLWALMKFYIETRFERNVDRKEICLKRKTFTIPGIL
jgi:hypothetical protein